MTEMEEKAFRDDNGALVATAQAKFMQVPAKPDPPAGGESS